LRRYFITLYNHFIDKVFAPEQYGFRNKLSADLASYKLLNILTALTNRSTVGGVFWDIRKAFDCVHHKF
jgi:hypothetical protein